MENRLRCLLTCFLLGLVLLANQAMGSELDRVPAAQPPKSKQVRKQVLSFDDELIEGATQKPELFYLFQKKNFNYKRLIRLRENFLPEMRKTSEEINRSRSRP